MLGIDGQQGLVRGKRHDEVATHDERLLVGEREGAASFERVVGGAHARLARKRVEHDIDIVELREGRDGSCAKANAHVVAELRERRRITHAFIAKGQMLAAKLACEGHGLVHTSACRQGDDLDPVGVHAHDIERLRANGTGGA